MEVVSEEVSTVSTPETQETTAPVVEQTESTVTKVPPFVQKLVPLSKNISFYIGAIAMFFIGTFFMVMADLIIKCTSDRLIVSVLLSFGSAILFFLSLSYNEKPKIMFVLKGIAIALAIGFIVYVHLFQVSEFYLGVLEKFRKAGTSKAKDLAWAQATMVITLIFGYISLVAQGVNTTLVAVIKEE